MLPCGILQMQVKRMNVCSGEHGMYFIPYVICLEKEALVVGVCDVPRELFLPQGVCRGQLCQI